MKIFWLRKRAAQICVGSATNGNFSSHGKKMTYKEFSSICVKA